MLVVRVFRDVAVACFGAARSGAAECHYLGGRLRAERRPVTSNERCRITVHRHDVPRLRGVVGRRWAAGSMNGWHPLPSAPEVAAIVGSNPVRLYQDAAAPRRARSGAERDVLRVPAIAACSLTVVCHLRDDFDATTRAVRLVPNTLGVNPARVGRLYWRRPHRPTSLHPVVSDAWPIVGQPGG